MAKTSVTQWDTTADNNTDVGGIGIQGTNKPSNFDNGLREVMAQIATFITSATFTGSTPVTLTSADDGASAGPTLDLYRNSASPAVSDVLGRIQFNGKDSAGNKQEYAFLQAIIADPSSASEDATLQLGVTRAGTALGIITISGGGMTLTHQSTITTINTDDDANQLILQGGNSASQGGQIFLYGDGHSTNANDVAVYTSNTLRYIYDHSAGGHMWAQSSTTAPGSGNNTVGMALTTSTGALAINTSASHIFGKTADGTVAVINSGGTAQGTIAISGATTSYNAFFGSHWSQLADGSKPEILRGTICESIDAMSEWPEGVDDRLPRFKISDTPGSRAVYGVFAWWDDFEADKTNDALIGGLGAFVVRMAPGQKVQRGDYVESNGDGCGRVQADDVMRASTVAKITSATVAETYPDGSFLVPCTLHCG